MIRCWSILLLTLLLATSAIGADKKPVYGHPAVSFDDRPWEIGFRQSDDRSRLVEYIPKGQTMTNWTERISIQRFPELQRIPAREYLQRTIQALEKAAGIPANVGITTEGPYGLLYTWQIIDAPSHPDQHELGVILPGRHALHFIRYSRRGALWSEQDRKAWVERWKQIAFRYPPSRRRR